MITRPLDLASRLSPQPRNFDVLFYVNVAALVLFFLLFGSRFVLAPGLALDEALPGVVGARAGAVPTSCHLRVLSSGQILTDEGLLSEAELPNWLAKEGRRVKNPALLLVASVNVPVGDFTRIVSMAATAGLKVELAARNALASGVGR